MENKIDCGFGVSITPTTKKIMGLDYFDYEITNSCSTKSKEVK
jgi:hypothetical protein